VREEYFKIEQGLYQGDMDILEQKELRNVLESYSYEMRNNLDSYGSFEKYLDEPTKKEFLAEINQVVEWLYADGENAPKEEYSTRIAKFRSIGDPVKNRHYYYSELDLYFEQHENAQKDITNKIASKPDLTDMQKEQIGSKQNSAASLMDGVKKDRESKQLFEDPAYKLDDVINCISNLKSETEGIFSLPPPKEKSPDAKMDGDDEKKEEKPAEEADKGKEDVEMKNEEKPAEEAK